MIAGLIVVNASVLGLETSPAVMEQAGPLLRALDAAILAVFVVEIAARIYVHRLAFFRDPWSVFDFIVVGIALVPSLRAGSRAARAPRSAPGSLLACRTCSRKAEVITSSCTVTRARSADPPGRSTRRA